MYAAAQEYFMRGFILDRELGDAVSEAAIVAVRDYTVGFARAGDVPAAKGTGVLVSYKGVHGIITAAHVDRYLRTLDGPIGIVRLNRGLTNQSSVFHLDEVLSFAAGENPYPDDDISFIHVPPHFVGDIGRSCSFLPLERNFEVDEPSETGLVHTYSIFGMVEEFTGATTRNNGVATTAMKGVLTPGRMLSLDAQVGVLECHRENIPDLPYSFGGTSGGGLWQLYFRKGDDGKYSVVHKRLIGIASSEEREKPHKIRCQSLNRILGIAEGAYGRVKAKS
jgi:hypothetical protein